MSGIFKVFLLLAVMVYMSKAHIGGPGQQCLCQRVRNGISRSPVKDIQIYPATIFCDKVEIVVTASNGLRYCLNPNLNAVKKLVVNILKNKKAATTARPYATSGPGSTNTARISTPDQ